MLTRTAKQAIVWGGLLIVVGALLLVEAVTDLSPWIWVVLLVAAAVVATVLYSTDRSDLWMLITTYALWAIAVLVALVTLNILRDEAVAFYVLLAIAMPFLAVYYRDRRQWWALIPAYVLIVVAVMVLLTEMGLLSDLLVPAYVLLAIAIPFFVVYARDRKLWWALIPGGILAVIGLSFLVAGAAIEYIGALVLILVGVGVLARAFTRKKPEPELPAAASPESEVAAEEHEE
jgi:predicted membrane protein